MSWKNIIDCLRTGEDEFTEFLTSVDSVETILKYVIAFLNNKGGRIIVGIDDKNDHLIGSNVSISFIETALQKIEPHSNIEVENVIRSGKNIIYIKVPDGRSKPYSYKNKYYLRKDKDVEKLRKEDLYGIGGAGATAPMNDNFNARQKDAIEFLKIELAITNKIYRTKGDVSHKTAHLELTELLTKGIIDKFGQGRNTAYRLAK
ncbi:MAG: ATP-binding protein [Candidatus Margulisbacteria bacterium]|nr:ATP-binding protein [Candidatus Margulisiibacteriota bacterium]